MTFSIAEAVTVYIDCWPCPKCGVVYEAGLCTDECQELLGYCEGCDDWHFVRPYKRRQFQLGNGRTGWWTEDNERDSPDE